MRVIVSLVLLSVVAIAARGPEVPAAFAPACTMMHFTPPLVKWDSLLHVGVTVLSERVPVSRWAGRAPPEREELMQYWPRGHVVAIADVEHGASDGLTEEDEILAFRWGLGLDCSWYNRRDSLPSGTEQYLTLLPRPDSLWVGGLPTYDIAPQMPDAFPGPGGPSVELPLIIYRDFVDHLPTEGEWQADCRGSVRRIEGWIEAHPDVAGHPRVGAALRQRYYCNHRLYNDSAYAYMRWDDVDAAPPGIEAWGLERGCEPVWEEPGERLSAVPGDFMGTGSDEWAFLCRRGDRWTLNVVTFDDPPRTVDVMGMVGDPADWLPVAASPKVFDFLTAVEFLDDPGRARPERDVILLHQMPFERIIALFHTDEGWRSARVRCCNWPDG